MKPGTGSHGRSDMYSGDEIRGLDRQTFMARVRAALGRAPHQAIAEPPPAVDASLLRLCRQDEDLPARFLEQARAVGMHTHRTTESEAGPQVRSLLVEHHCRSVAASVADASLDETVRQAVVDAGCTSVDWRSSPGLEAHYDVDVGITDVDAALAESGSIVISSGPTRSRGTFLVPPMHIALVRAGDVLADMIDYWDRRRGELSGPGSAVSFITGPSKTADIEGILITGVHGPGDVHIVLLDPSGS